MVSLFGRDSQDAFGPVSYESYLTLQAQRDAFELLGAARESQGTVVLRDRASVMSIAAVTPELAELLHLPLDEGSGRSATASGRPSSLPRPTLVPSRFASTASTRA